MRSSRASYAGSTPAGWRGRRHLATCHRPRGRGRGVESYVDAVRPGVVGNFISTLPLQCNFARIWSVPSSPQLRRAGLPLSHPSPFSISVRCSVRRSALSVESRVSRVAISVRTSARPAVTFRQRASSRRRRGQVRYPLDVTSSLSTNIALSVPDRIQSKRQYPSG